MSTRATPDQSLAEHSDSLIRNRIRWERSDITGQSFTQVSESECVWSAE